METPQEVVDVFLGVPVLVTLTRITNIAIVAEFLHVLVLDTQHVHHLLVVVNMGGLFWKRCVT